ncbi:MAG: hypothetical protein ACNFW9_02435 [Candidatus Kerfeldbacteria bacterium]|jgi:arginine exporter protein ArgO
MLIKFLKFFVWALVLLSIIGTINILITGKGIITGEEKSLLDKIVCIILDLILIGLSLILSIKRWHEYYYDFVTDKWCDFKWFIEEKFNTLRKG